MTHIHEWLSLRQAAEILGVHPATVRAWADKGNLPSRRTPGGHRRFRKSDLLHYAATQSEVQPAEVQIIVQNALGQTRMEVGSGTLDQIPWYTAMRESTRDALRQQGRRVLEDLRQYIAADAPDVQLANAIRLGTEYAQLLQADELTLPQAVRGFLYFSDFVINAVLTWSEIAQPRNPQEWSHLLRHVNTYTHAVLLSIIEYYEAD